MEGDRMAPVIVIPLASAGERFRDCLCCGRWFTPRHFALFLAGGRALSGPVCPDCVILGPGGAATLLRQRARERSGRGEASAKVRRALGAWVRLVVRRAETLERARAFPLAARRAAIRETREKR